MLWNIWRRETLTSSKCFTNSHHISIILKAPTSFPFSITPPSFIQYTNTSHRWGGTTVHTLFCSVLFCSVLFVLFCPMSLFSITSLLCLKSCFVLSGEVTNGGINVIEQYWKLSSVAIINDFRWKQWKKEMLPTFLDFNLFVFLSVKREGRFLCIWWELKGGLCLF